MPTSVVYPKVSLEQSSGRISRWLVADGDSVSEGQVIFEIDNDKAAVEVEAPAAGILRGLTDVETEVEVGATVAAIFGVGEPAADTENGAATTTASPAPIPPTVVTAHVGQRSGRRGPNPTPLARRIARERGVTLEGLAGTGPRGRVQKKDVLAHIAALANEPSAISLAPANAAGSTPPAPVIPRQADAGRLNAVWMRRGEGVAAVLLHGFGADLNNWRGLLACARGSRPVLALDLPAHGRSPRVIPQDLDAMAEMVEATLAAEDVGPVVLSGHSFGGALVVRVAARGYADVRGLCLFAPAGLGPEINQSFTEGILRARRAESLRPWLELLVDDPAVISEMFLRAVVQQRKDAELTAAMRLFAARFFPDGTQGFSIRPDLAGLSQPLRIVFGRQDNILPFATTRILPGAAALHAFDRCGHMPHLEHPELSLRILEEVCRSA